MTGSVDGGDDVDGQPDRAVARALLLDVYTGHGGGALAFLEDR